MGTESDAAGGVLVIVACDKCQWAYDDAERLTYCPHAPIMSAYNLEQKDAGIALLGKPVRFVNQPSSRGHMVRAVGWNGMVTLDDMAGEFSPYLFVLMCTDISP